MIAGSVMAGALLAAGLDTAQVFLVTAMLNAVVAGYIFLLVPEYLQPFKGGTAKILASRPVPVVPMALCNLWGSFFSRIEGGRAMVKPLRCGLFNRVALVAAAPLAPAQAEPAALQAAVQRLLDEAGDDAEARRMPGDPARL